MADIFISYRRADSNHIAGRIYDRLAAQFGKDSLFKDVDNIRFGTDFRRTLMDAIDRCHVVLVVIGDQWLNIADESGQRRLHIEGDFVRMEIEAALARGVPIIPLMVGRASMPSIEDLPPSLQRLAHFNGTVIRPDPDFHHDVTRLIPALEEYRHGKTAESARGTGGPVGRTVSSTSRTLTPPVDVIELMRTTQARALKAHAEARRLMEAEWDYAGAAALLEGLPAKLRDATLYSSLCERRDRVARLDQQVLEAVQTQDLEDLHPRVVELLELTPQRDDLRRLVEFLTKQDAARHLVEERRDVVQAAALMEKIPEYLYDRKLMESLRVLKERAARLTKVIREERKARHLMELRRPLEELDRLTPGRDDLQGMIKAVAKNEEAQKLVENHGDYTRALALLEDLPENLRDASLFTSLCDRRNRVDTLRKEIGDDLGSRRICQLRLKIEELSRLQREPIADPLTGRALLEVVAIHEEADQHAETMRDFAGAIALLDDLQEHLRDGTLYSLFCEKRDRAVLLDQEINHIIQSIDEFMENCKDFDTINILETRVKQGQLTGLFLTAKRLRENLTIHIDEIRLLRPLQEFEPLSDEASSYYSQLSNFESIINAALTDPVSYKRRFRTFEVAIGNAALGCIIWGSITACIIFLSLFIFIIIKS